MRRLAVLLCSVLLTLPLFAKDDFHLPTKEEMELKDVSWAPGANAVVLEWIVKHDDEVSVGSEYYRIKILKAEGKDQGDIEIPYIPGTAGVKDIRARTIRPDGTVVPFTGKIYEKVLLKSGGLKLLQKTFSLPNVEPGAILEIHVGRFWSPENLNANRWELQKDIPIAKASFWIKPYHGVASVCTSLGLKPEQMPKRQGEGYAAEITNMPAFEDEPLSPPTSEIKAYIDFYYTAGTDAEHYWLDTGKRYSGYIEDFIGRRSGIKRAAEELTAGATDESDKLRRLYDRVQKIENISFEPEKTDQEEKRAKRRESHDIEDVLKANYGTRDELNRLFVGLARALGFDAGIVMTSQRDRGFFSKKRLDFSQLPVEIAVVKVGGVDRFFDPGTPFAPFGLLPWANTGIDGVRADVKTGGKWLVTPVQNEATATTKRYATLKLQDDVLVGTVRLVFDGQEALIERLAGLHQDEAENRKRIEDDVKGYFPEGATVKLTKIDKATDATAPLEYTFDVELPHLGTVTGSRTLVPLSVFAASRGNLFGAEKRKYDIYFPYARQASDVVTLEVPAGYVVENVPAATTLDEKIFRYATKWTNTADKVTFERTSMRGGVIIAAAQYPRLRAFFARIATADQDSVVLKRAK